MILLAGPEFADSGAILNILIVATASIFFGTLFTYLVVALKIQKQMIKYFLIAAVVGLLGYFIFVPLFSYWGAAYMTLIVEVLIWIFAYMVVRKHLTIKLDLKVLAKALLAGLVTLVFTWLIKDINLALTILVAVFLYSATLYFTKAVDKSSLRQLLKPKDNV